MAEYTGWGLPWVTRDPDFRESEDVDTVLPGFVDYLDCLVDGALEVEPHWFSLDCPEADCFFGHCYYFGVFLS